MGRNAIAVAVARIAASVISVVAINRSRRRKLLPPLPPLALPREPSGTFSASSSPSFALHQNLWPSLHAEL
jgi:hypothetical protein